ncbi:MAG: DUF2079 domain-containing protein [Chloroflexi bacterium]|nr:DUF2079 domain-containing protein [Chloroflexota bacterium]
MLTPILRFTSGRKAVTENGRVKSPRRYSRWIYGGSVYPALIALPYFVLTDRYSGITRAGFVLACSALCLVLSFVVLSGRMERLRERLAARGSVIISLAVVGYVLVFFYLAYGVRLSNGLDSVTDTALIEQILWAGSQGHLFYSSYYNGVSLSSHFAPMLVPLTYLYAPFQNIGVVFLLKISLLALTAVPLYGLACDSSDRLSALFISFAFLLSPAVVSQHFQLYMNDFAPFFWMCAGLFFFRKRMWLFLVFSVLAASVQEDIAFSLLVFAVLAWLERRPARWKLVTVLFPAAWFMVGMLVIQLSPGQIGQVFGGHFTDLGQTPWEIARSLALNPNVVLAKILDNAPSKALWAYELLGPLLFLLPLASPVALGALPDGLVFGFIPLDSSQYSVSWYYSLLITTVLFMALVVSLRKLAGALSVRRFGVRISRIVGVTVLCSNLVLWPLVLSPAMFATDAGQRISTVRRIQALIPPDACVATTYDIAQLFARRYQLYTLGIDPDEKVLGCRYVVVTEAVAGVEKGSANYRRLFNVLEEVESYRLLLTENGFQVFVKR